MKKACLVGLIICFAAGLAFSQTFKGKGRITGIVTDEQGNPIEGVTVKLFSLRGNNGFSVTTDKDGRWTAAWIRGGGWNIDFEKIGFAPKKISMSITEMGPKTPPVEISLKAVEGMTVTDDLKDKLIAANNLFEMGQLDEAIAAYQAMLAENPEAYVINRNIGNAYFKQENYDEAMVYYQKILDKDPENSDAMLLIGNCYTNKGEDETALEWYNRIELEQITDPDVLYNIGTQYYGLSKFDEALRYYQRSVDIQPEYLDGIYQLGLCNLTLGNQAEAIASFEKYLTLDSESERATQVQGFLDYLKK